MSLPGPHRRYDPLRDAWVLVSAGRSARPWHGQVEQLPPAEPQAYDPVCQLCPGNTRANGVRNPTYEATFAFTNDFPALRKLEGDANEPCKMLDGILRAETETGTARVLCFSPSHDRSLGSLSDAERRRVVDLWADETAELTPTYPWVQVFENRGEAMGASNPHPHGQLWAGTALPNEAAREAATQRAYFSGTGRRLLADIADQEAGGPRAIVERDDWLAIVPFWAAWPFEVLLIARRPALRLPDLGDVARDDLAAMLGEILRGYDALFDRPFPYSMGWHQAPAGPDPGDVSAWQLHAHVYPPLLGAEKRKFMVGYELLAEPQRDLTPEDAAAALRAAVAAGSRN